MRLFYRRRESRRPITTRKLVITRQLPLYTPQHCRCRMAETCLVVERGRQTKAQSSAADPPSPHYPSTRMPFLDSQSVMCVAIFSIPISRAYVAMLRFLCSLITIWLQGWPDVSLATENHFPTLLEFMLRHCTHFCLASFVAPLGPAVQSLPRFLHFDRPNRSPHHRLIDHGRSISLRVTDSVYNAMFYTDLLSVIDPTARAQEIRQSI